jgi:inner membrane protein involved in colicin E2 resistance
MKTKTEFEQFDKVMGGLLAVPYAELQKKLKEEKRDKAKHKKKRPTSTASSRVASSRTKRDD